MADLVTGAMGSLIPKLGELLKEEYSLQTGVKERIRSLTMELELAQATLHKVAQVPWYQLDKKVQIWAHHVREASYDMEDILDSFLVHVQGPDSSNQEKSLLRPLKKLAKLFKGSKARRKISGDVKDIMAHLQEVAERWLRYKVDDIVAVPATTSTVDPRLHAMYNKVKNLVGIDKSSDELISMLQPLQRDDASNVKMKIVSVVGVGGLGKTTLAKAVYDKLKGDFDCGAFVPVGQNPCLKKVLKDILMDLDRQRQSKFSNEILDERQLINELRSFLEKKRYFIVIDDIWEIPSWETIKLAIGDDNNCGARIIITTRKLEVAKEAEEFYRLQPLPDESSRELLFTRIYGHEGKSVDNGPDEISDKFVRKCAGIPLAIITMGSLLAGKPRDKWSELYNTIDFGSKDNKEAENTMRILSFSYYDLPSHLRTCLLYLSAFPEDSFIDKGSLVWKWVAEGFVQEKVGITLFESGEGYFNDLVNRSMIQAVESGHVDGIIIGCRVHDMVLDFICSMSREENFITILDNNQDTLLQSNAGRQSNARRLAYHKRTIGHCHQSNGSEIPKLRSFIGLWCVIEKWAPLSSFTLLRVLAIEECKSTDGSHMPIQVGDLRHLLQLRYLSLRGTWIDRIPREIGALRFLQTLDLWRTFIPELPSSSRFLKQLLCLRITLADDHKVVSVEGMTSLEELTIWTHGPDSMRQAVKELGSLTELRVLCVHSWTDEEYQRDLVESLRHLHKLQSLDIGRYSGGGCGSWKATELDLPRHLRHLVVSYIELFKLPSCINPGCLPNLSHLDLWLQHMDEQDLKILGRLPELRFLRLRLWSSSDTMDSITWNISDTDGGCYFPKLRCCKLPYSMVKFVANKDDKHSVSFHIWNAVQDIAMPSVSVSEDENKGSICVCSKGSAAAPPSFMPSLQVLDLELYPAESHPNCCDNLGWEYLSSLREIHVGLNGRNRDLNDKVKAALRCTAQVHPNHPTLHFYRL